MSICPSCGQKIRENPKNPGNALRRHRVAVGQSLTEVHKATGITKSMLSRIEVGLGTPGLNTAAKLATHYGLTIDEIHRMLTGDLSTGVPMGNP